MNKQELLKRLDALIDEAIRIRTWGTIQIDFQNGVPNLIRETKMTKLQLEGIPHHVNYERR
ncbi:MAG TPA: hypothetical protein VKS44_08620 [Candidatus Acidoferrales bacterium]|nr:hypothetical protein [Candidatus Acidoferrales bacterium]